MKKFKIFLGAAIFILTIISAAGFFVVSPGSGAGIFEWAITICSFLCALFICLKCLKEALPYLFFICLSCFLMPLVGHSIIIFWAPIILIVALILSYISSKRIKNKT